MLRILSLVLIACALACAEPISADGLIRAVEARYNSANTLSVNFVEQFSILGHARQPETGRLTLRKQGKMRWDYSRPEGKLFVSDGKNVFLYTAGDNRVEKVPSKHTEDMRAPLAFLLGRLDMKKEFRDFRVEETPEGAWLDGSAKSDRILYESVRMLVGAQGTIRELQVVERDQSRLSFSFTDERVNPPVNDQIFHFTVPAGAEVVDAVEFGAQEN